MVMKELLKPSLSPRSLKHRYFDDFLSDTMLTIILAIILTMVLEIIFGHKKTPRTYWFGVFLNRSLAVCYSHMGKPHTTIAANTFHY